MEIIMEILQLKYFQRTAKTENISKTAKEFMVPPSSVSAAIKKLEKEFSVSLFDRTANSLKLNENGKILLRAVENCEKEFKKAKIDLMNRPESGEIKLLMLTNRSSVTDAMVNFKSDYPDVSFTISHESDADHSKFDIVISDKLIDSDDFNRKEFINEEISLAVHKSHPLAKETSVKLKSLKNDKFILMSKGSRMRIFTDRLFEGVGTLPNPAIESSDPYYICRYLKMGLGITFFPSVSWQKQIDDTVKLLKINEGIYRTSYLYTNKSCAGIAEIFAQNLELSVKKEL